MSARIFYDRVRPPHHASKVFKLVAHDKATVMVMPGDYGTIQKMARQGYFFDIDMIDGLEQAVYASRIRGQSHFEDWTYSGTHVAFTGEWNPDVIVKELAKTIGHCVLIKIPLGLVTRDNQLIIPAFFKREDFALWKVMSANLKKHPVAVNLHKMIYGYDSGFYFSTDPNIEYIPSSTLLADWGIDA